MNWSWTTILGVAAAAITTAANIPQVVKAYQTAETEAISLTMTLMLALGLSLWALYGFLQSDPVILIANLIATCLALALVFLKLRHG